MEKIFNVMLMLGKFLGGQLSNIYGNKKSLVEYMHILDFIYWSSFLGCFLMILGYD